MHAGDEHAARRLWAHAAPRLIAAASAITADHADALDAVQEAMLGVLRLSAHQVACIDDPHAYLAGAVRLRAINILRDSARRSVRHARAVVDHPLRLAHTEPEQDQLARALTRLPEEAREILALKHIAGLTFDQLAQVLCVPRGTLVSRHAAALEQVRFLLDRRAHV